MSISSQFDSGNIECISQQENIFQLKLRKDSHANYSQWFYFSLTGQKDKATQLQIMDAAESSYPEGWEGYRALISYDRKSWVRVPTRYEEGRLIIEHTPEQSIAYYAYFVPYTYEDYLNWISTLQARCVVNSLTKSFEGRMMHYLQVGEAAPHKKKCWFIARQHSGEAMASWFIEGLLETLLKNKNTLTKDAVFYIIPLMNPDGVALGNLRANAHGLDLNRQWPHPDPKFCPEVFYAREKMHEIGVDFFMDVHGDEALPYVFLATSRDNPSHTEQQTVWENLFSKALLATSTEFQTEYGYARNQFGASMPALACNYVADHFKSLALTLEMPFKDNANLPDSKEGWSPVRSAKLAEKVIEALMMVLPQL